MRIDPTGTPEGEADLAMLASVDVAQLAIMVPKAERIEDLDKISALRLGCRIVALVESARGVAAPTVLAAHAAVARVALGELDLAVDLDC